MDTKKQHDAEVVKKSIADKQKIADAHNVSSFGHGEYEFKEDEIRLLYRRLVALGL